MQVMKCDRCGKIFDEYEGILVNTELNRNYWRWRDCKSYDLCPDCMKELKDFLKGAQNNERL